MVMVAHDELAVSKTPFFRACVFQGLRTFGKLTAEDCQIMGGGNIRFLSLRRRQAMYGIEMGILHSQLRGLLVHQDDKALF